MKRVTIRLDDDLYAQGHDLAKKQKMTFSSLIRQLLQLAVHNTSDDWMKEWFRQMDKAHYNSGGGRDWKREDLYRV